MEGFGFYSFADGKTYEGEYKKDKKHGFGIYSWTDGKVYEGWWTNGKQDGYGYFTNKDGSKKIGEWRDGKKIKWISEDEETNIQREHKEAAKAKELSLDEINRLTFVRPSDFEKKKLHVTK